MAFSLHLDSADMTITGIHRFIERHAATRGESIALVDGDRHITYRELNQRANTTARHLIATGFRRGSHAVVKMERSVDLAVILLAVLKAGGLYTWLDRAADASWPAGVSVAQGNRGSEVEYIAADLTNALIGLPQAGPNLPVLTRGTDVACVLPGGPGSPAVLVPHATITALQFRPVPPVTRWSDEPGTLGLWLALMSGTTVVLSAEPETVAA